MRNGATRALTGESAVSNARRYSVAPTAATSNTEQYSGATEYQTL
jgi:hypothetical protein